MDKAAETPLSGVCAEFRTALQAEIAAAERAAATSTIPLDAGRKIGRVAGAWQYVFSAISAGTIPSDSPGELVVEGLPPMQVVVVSAEGLDLTLRVSADLGDRVPGAVLRRDLVFPLRCLIARIEDAGGTPNPAGARLLGDMPASGVPEVIDNAPPDSAQAAALGSALGRDITFICAPPGTEKTQTIGSIGAHLHRRGRSVLLVAHTNRAVDQALVEIAQQLGDERADGALLRVGIPCDHRLLEREDLLFEAVIWNRQAQLREREAGLRAHRADTRRQIAEYERLIGVAACAADGPAQLAGFLSRLDSLHSREASARRLAEQVARAASGEAELLARLAEGQTAARAASEARRLCAQLARLAAELDTARSAVAVADAAVTRTRSELDKAVELEPVFARERALPSLAEQRRAVEVLAAREAEAKREADAARATLREAEAYTTANRARATTRRLRHRVTQVRGRRVVAQRRARLETAQAMLAGIGDELGRASALLAELEDLDRQLAPWRKLSSAAERDEQLRRREDERRIAAMRQTQLEQRREEAEQQLADAAAAVEQFRGSCAAEPVGLVARIEPLLAELRHLREKLRETERRASDMRTSLDADLRLRMAAIENLGLGLASTHESAEARFVELALAQSEATRRTAEIDVAVIEAKVTAARRQLGAIETALARNGTELEAIRHTAIADAGVIATTLMRVYLGGELHDRRFDTVILDEASMAPIPALWIAARLADASVVVVGDVGRRPPHWESGHPLADKWLGQDIFTAVRGRSSSHPGNPVIQLI